MSPHDLAMRIEQYYTNPETVEAVYLRDAVNVDNSPQDPRPAEPGPCLAPAQKEAQPDPGYATPANAVRDRLTPRGEEVPPPPTRPILHRR